MARDSLDFLTTMREALDAKSKGICALWADPLGDDRYDCRLELPGRAAPVCGIATLAEVLELTLDEPRIDTTVGLPGGCQIGPERDRRTRAAALQAEEWDYAEAERRALERLVGAPGAEVGGRRRPRARKRGVR